MKNGFRIDSFGTKRWFLNGQFHREDGPAIIYPNGDQFWYKNGKLHREDGPAIVCINGYGRWFIHSKEYKTIHEYAVAMGWDDVQIARYLLSN